MSTSATTTSVLRTRSSGCPKPCPTHRASTLNNFVLKTAHNIAVGPTLNPMVGLQHCGTMCRNSTSAPHPTICVLARTKTFYLLTQLWRNGALNIPNFKTHPFYLFILGCSPPSVPTEVLTTNMWLPQCRTAGNEHVFPNC